MEVHERLLSLIYWLVILQVSSAAKSNFGDITWSPDAWPSWSPTKVMQLITLIRTLNTDSLAFYSMLFTFRQTLDLFRSIFQTLHTLKSHHWNLGPGDQDWNQITLMKSNKVILKWRPRTTDWVVLLTTDWVNASNWGLSLSATESEF